MMQVAIVTGASRGIGAAAARLLGRHGYAVAVNYRANERLAQDIVRDIESAGQRAIAVQGDVGDRDDVERLFATVDESLGKLTALVNNAGVTGPRCRLEELSLADLDQVMTTNLTGAVLCSQAAIRRMSTRHGGEGGAIVNVSSGAAYRGNPGNGVQYAISKGALNSLTIGLSQEVAGEGIRVNAVSPGLTRTDMPDPRVLADAGNVIAMGRVGEPEEIAEAILWLLSDKASYVSGANIRVAGGRT